MYIFHQSWELFFRKKTYSSLNCVYYIIYYTFDDITMRFLFLAVNFHNLAI